LTGCRSFDLCKWAVRATLRGIDIVGVGVGLAFSGGAYRSTDMLCSSGMIGGEAHNQRA